MFSSKLRFELLTYGLFNDAVKNSDYIVTNVRIIMNNEVAIRWKQA